MKDFFSIEVAFVQVLYTPVYVDFTFSHTKLAKSSEQNSTSTAVKAMTAHILPLWMKMPVTVVVNMPESKNKASTHVLRTRALEKIEQLSEARPEAINIYTDGSHDPITGDAGAAIYIPRDGVLRGTKISDHASNLTTELAAIILALLWTEE